MEPVQSHQSTHAQPRFSGMSHVSLACRDLEQSKLFYSRVLGGEWVLVIAGFVEYRIANVIFGLAERPAGWTGAEHEYPHYAFYIDGENFGWMKRWLAFYGVPHYPYRRDETALIYFRDPSGNLFELYCDRGYEDIDSLPPAPRRGGPEIDFRRLNYAWNSRAALEEKAPQPAPRFDAFAHASLYCHDLEQAKRFYTKVLGGEVIHDVDGFSEVRLAGIIIGITVRPGTTTAPAAEYPHYAFLVESDDLLPAVSWLRQNGVVTSEPWTRDGVKGLLYFRDPSGNLLELYCRKSKDAAGVVRIDFDAPNYSWQG